MAQVGFVLIKHIGEINKDFVHKLKDQKKIIMMRFRQNQNLIILNASS